MLETKLVKILEDIAQLLELKGENPFKAKAYTNAAQTIKRDKIKIAEAVKNNTLRDIKGFGDALQKKITEFVETGMIEYYEKLLSEIPKGLYEISKIQNIGFVKARTLFYDYDITSVDLLQEACENDKLSSLRGFGHKSQEMILNSIYHIKAKRGKVLLESVSEEAEKIAGIINNLPGCETAEVTGELRRVAEVISDVSIIASTDNSDELFEQLKEYFNLEKDNDTFYYNFNDDFKFKIYTAAPGDYGWKLLELTGNSEFNQCIVEALTEQGYTIRDSSLFRSNIKIRIHNEIDIFKILSMDFIPPELRESRKVINAAQRYSLPKLIENSDLKGMLHVHSLWSDGTDTIKEMALKSRELGFSYVAICDHSKSAVYANGLTIERITEQHEEIDRLNEELDGIKILKGIESDILPDGSLDYSPDILEKFDVVVASVHSGFNLPKKTQTSRIIYALRSQYTTILGHPTGRLLLARPPYELDIEEIIDAAAEYRKIIEINANPYRLDLNWENAIYAREKGVKLAINPDSHAASTLKDVFTGVKIARKAWLTASDVVNCLSLKEFKKLIKS